MCSLTAVFDYFFTVMITTKGLWQKSSQKRGGDNVFIVILLSVCCQLMPLVLGRKENEHSFCFPFYLCFTFSCHLEATVRAGHPAIQFGWRVSSLHQFLWGEADVLQHSRPPVWTQSGCGENRQTAQPFICLSRKVSEPFFAFAYFFLLLDHSIKQNAFLPPLFTSG